MWNVRSRVTMQEGGRVGVVVVVAALVLPMLLLLYYMRKQEKQQRNQPPEAPGLPLIGHLHLLRKHPHVSLFELSRLHGPLLRLRLGMRAVIVASTPHAARQILQVNDLAFSSRPVLLFASRLLNCTGIGFGSPAQPHWRFLRHLCFTHLFSKKRLEWFLPLRTEEVRALVKSILKSAGVPINMRVALHRLASNIICRMVLGKSLMQLEEEAAGAESIIDLTVEMNNLAVLFNLGDYFPMLAWLDIQGIGRRTTALVQKFEPILQAIIDERRREYSAGTHPDSSPQDFLDDLLKASDSHGDSPILTHQNVKSALLDMFGGGIDTSSISIEWALGELLANPTKLKTLQEELENVVGMDRLVEESDIPYLPYLRAVVKEVLRLHPVGPLLIPHFTTQACEVLGYGIPANTIAFINAWALGRDPNSWEDASKFLPERFLGKDIDVNGQCFELLPFGSGRRMCPGWALGLVTVQIALASLIQAFHWTIAGDLNLSEDDIHVLPSIMASPLIVRATPKLSGIVF